MRTETYEVWMLRCGLFYFWTGRNWDIRPYNGKCYATKDLAEKAMSKAQVKTTEKVSAELCSLTVPIG